MFKNGKKDGIGTFSNYDDCYKGEFKKGMYHGKGEFIWKCGKRYVGDYEYGVR